MTDRYILIRDREVRELAADQVFMPPHMVSSSTLISEHR